MSRRWVAQTGSASAVVLVLGTSPVMARNWFRSVGNTVIVTHMGVPV